MDTSHYLAKFQKIADQLDPQRLRQHQMEVKAGIMVRCVVLKMQKRAWTNPSPSPLSFQESIFFSAWLTDESIRERKLLYNIHALKLRQLIGYSIQSREFAAAFRSAFKPFAKAWPNVSLDFGPLTLMEGWVPVDPENFEAATLDLAYQFLDIQFIIDDLLATRKKKGK